MDQVPVVQVLLDGKVVAEVPFTGDVLRVGRMRDNEVVLPNLSVSRYHALLRREGDVLRVEDLGSENGCVLNGSPVQESAPFGPGDEIQIVRHVLRIRSDQVDADEDPDAELPSLRSEDAAPAQASLDTAPLRGAKPSNPPEETVVDLAEETGGEGSDHPAAGEGELPDGGEDERPGAGQGPLFDFSREEDLGRSDPALALTEPTGSSAEPAPPEPPESTDPSERYAGLIVQRDGRLERVLAWDAGQLCAGRSSSCEIPLASPRVSRRHALFVREGDRFEVRDLDSVGGVLVNGERALSHVLSVGDVVRVDDFDLTFVLDAQPVGEAVCTPDGDDEAEPADTGAPTQLGDAGLSEAAQAEVSSEAVTMPPRKLEGPGGAEPEAAPIPELDLVDEAHTPVPADDEKDLEVAVDSEPSAAVPIQVAPEPVRETLVLELELDGLDVPEPVRRWLADRQGPLRLPVELRLRRRESEPGD